MERYESFDTQFETLTDENIHEDEKVEIIVNFKDDLEKTAAIKNLIKDPRNKIIVASTLKDRKIIDKLTIPDKRKYSKVGIDPKITFATEIEVEGDKANLFLEAKEILFREIKGKKSSWKIVEDASLERGRSAELRPSGKFTDSKRTVEEIYEICSILEKCGLETNESCGLHIHVGASYFGKKPGKFDKYCRILGDIWKNTEDIMYTISNEEGELPRRGAKYFAKHIENLVEETLDTLRLRKKAVNREELEKEKMPFVKTIKGYQKNGRHYYSVNFDNIGTNKHTIEFRLFNGTLNPNAIVEDIRLVGRLLEVSKKIGDKKDKKLMKLYKKLEEGTEEEKAAVLFEMLFPEQSEKEVYQKRYEANTKLKKQRNEVR